MRKPLNVYEHSLGLTKTNRPLEDGNDWHPVIDEGFVSTDFTPGSPHKIAIMIKRLENGYPLWHADDRVNYTGYNTSIIGNMPLQYGRVPDYSGGQNE